MSFLEEIYGIQRNSINDLYDAYKDQLKAIVYENPYEIGYIVLHVNHKGFKCETHSQNIKNIIRDKFIKDGFQCDDMLSVDTGFWISVPTSPM